MIELNWFSGNGENVIWKSNKLKRDVLLIVEDMG